MEENMEVVFETESKPKARKAVNHVFLWLLLYNIFMAVIANFAGEDMGLGYVVSSLAAAGLCYLCTRKKWPVNPFEIHNKMTGKTFFSLFCILCAAQVLSFLLVYALNLLGLSGTSLPMDEPSVLMMIYIGFTGPFCEEIMYRGFTAGKLRSYGKIFAIIMSAIAFGFMHMNAAQLLAGFVSGLIFGYIFIEYSIFWTLLLHIINNFVLGMLPGLLFPQVAEETLNSYVNIAIMVFAAVGVIILIINRAGISAYIKEPENRAEKGAWSQALTSVWFWVFIIIYAAFIVVLLLNPELYTGGAALAAA